MQHYSLRAKFIGVIILISLVAGVATLLAFYTSTNGIINDLALRFATKEALLEKNKIISIIDREVVLARKMADDPTIRTWALHEASQEPRTQAFAELESYRRFYRDKSFFIALASSNHDYMYTNRSGRQQVEVSTLSTAKPDDRWFFEGLRTIDGYALNLDYNATLREARVWINTVMVDDQKKKIGICGGSITITDFLNEVVYTRQNGLSTILIDGSGIVQAHEDRKIVEHNAATRDAAQKITIYSMMDEASQQEKLREAIKTLTTGTSDVQAFPVRFDGKEYLLAVSYLRGMGWFNVVLVDVSRVISMKDFFPIVGIMALSLLLVIFTIGFLINRIVLAPLAKLSTASRDIAAGQYDIVLPVTEKDELGALTDSFNVMAATILDHTGNLEAKVRERTDELSEANAQLGESQRKIMESISYARVIQSSILPDQELMERCLGEHFILYRPKEIVGGDFYYLREFEGHSLLALVDCTGHGVPGAFMTMTVNAVLNHVVDVLCCDNPSRILSELNRLMHRTLHLKEVDAGLDIAICVIERRAGRVIYAGAGLPLTIVSMGIVREIRGDNQRVGYKGSRLDYAYTNHELNLTAGDCCYLTTDGLLDEAGGNKGFGFGSKRFKAVLAEHAHSTMPNQAQALAQALDDYRGSRHQRDDITTTGFRF